MRFVLKLLAGLFIIVLASTYFRQAQPPKISNFDQKFQDFISCFGLKKENLKTSLKQTTAKRKQKYFYIGRVYKIGEEFPLIQFEENLRDFLKNYRFKFKKENYGPDLKNIRYDFFFKKYKLYTLCLEKGNKAKLALVIDDWGYNPNLLVYLQKIRIPLNIAILPLVKYSKTTNEVAIQNGDEILLHLPMQPFPGEKMDKNLEKVTIKENLTQKELKIILTNFINSIDNIKGVNNHMGSLISKNRKIMSQILKVLKANNLYYLDSKVIPDSIAPEVAKKIGIRCFERDIFIDNQEKPDYIKNQIRKAIKLSQKKGYAIAIGHAKKTTLEVIKEMVPEIIENVYVVRLSELK